VDFRNLNQASDKDNYLVPPMEQILQLVSGSQMFSLLEGFFGYNQVLVAKPDQLKTTSQTKLGTFSYHIIPFGMINIGENFQWDMDISFKGLIGQRMVVYLDDVIIYSKKRANHPHHLKKIFERCKKYGISLNPKKSVFVVLEGKLLGHIISKDYLC
jgi:hypothetical protein